MLAKRFEFRTEEPRLRAFWEERGVHRFAVRQGQPIHSIDTPPPTVSGKLHMGHVYSYCQTDFIARFQRMRGRAVFYPMGFDDNGLPTEQLVERELGRRAEEFEPARFRARCQALSREAAGEYRELFRELGLSVDWTRTYRTIEAVRLAQWAFVDLWEKDLVYRREAPVIWCPACVTAISQADLEEIERKSAMHTIAFALAEGGALPVATTRPELLPACVAVFVHPGDPRFSSLIGGRVEVPLDGRRVEVRTDSGVDPDKGSGAVMCCTFGDSADVEWWREYDLELIEVLDRRGHLTRGPGRGLPAVDARAPTLKALDGCGALLGERSLPQAVRVHERCGTPVEYRVTPQWFVRVLDYKEELVEMGKQLDWRPAHMGIRYRQWVEGLAWDWCISRQRFFGVPFPAWHCSACGRERVASMGELPVDPRQSRPSGSCICGASKWRGESDVMDTWATSSLTPQIAGGLGQDDDLYGRVHPFSVRPLAHEIIRSWAFYSLVRARHHFGSLPWRTVAVSGWGLAPEGQGKISKSRGGSALSPKQLLSRYPADALRYWSASTGLGRDARISEDKMQAGARLSTKLWNVARFSAPFLHRAAAEERPDLSPADAWILAQLQEVNLQATRALEGYDHAVAKSAIVTFFWRDLADNYLEMAKKRLYGRSVGPRRGACWTLERCLATSVKLLAPFLPYVTEAIYQALFSHLAGGGSLHQESWPQVDETLRSKEARRLGAVLVDVGTVVRRRKSAAKLPLGTPLERLQVVVPDARWRSWLAPAEADIASLTRALLVEVVEKPEAGLEVVKMEGRTSLALDWGESCPHRSAGKRLIPT